MASLQELAAKALAHGGGDPAIEFAGEWLSWDQLHQAGRTVLRLIDESGADPRAPVLLIARNTPAAYSAFVALIAAGRTIRMVYSFQSAEAKAVYAEQLKAGIVIAGEEDFSEKLRAAASKRGAAAIALSAREAWALPGLERSTAPPDPGAPGEPVIEIQTSGTTGLPKRFPVTFAKAHEAFIQRGALGGALGDVGALPPALLYTALGNVSGMIGALPALLLGMRIILHDRFSLDAWRDYVRRYRPVRMGLPPAAFRMLLDADPPVDELSSIKVLIAGSAPLNRDVQREFEARYGIDVLLAYGATEFLGTVASMSPQLIAEWGESKYGSVGRAVAGVQLRIADPDTGAVLGPGEQGVVEARVDVVGPHWIRTADLAVLDEDQFLFMRGRADGAIVRGGFKLLPETIEHALLSHPAVAAAAVVGVPDRRLGEVPGAAIQLKRGVAPPGTGELEAHLRERLLATHIPVHWRFVDDLPRTQSVKTDRGAVARLFAE
jgi:long-chain acyl-CoA synthetase